MRQTAPPNVELKPWVTRSELAALYARASGFIHAANEDFGITMVEALASGTPVIALGEGGALDIVRDGRDGLLIQSADVATLRLAVRRVAEEDWDAHDLALRAEAFSHPLFIEQIDRWIADVQANQGARDSSREPSG